MRLVGLLLVSFGVAASGCVRSAPVLAPVEVSVGAASTSSAPRASLPGPRRCTATLVAGDIDTGESCFLDERISKGDGILTYPCSGDGVVEAVFGEHRFEGAITGGRIVLSLTSEIDWDEDHCRWQSRQSIRGELARGTLAWSYTERPIHGDSCSGACTARATLDIEHEGGPPRHPTPPDDDDPDGD